MTTPAGVEPHKIERILAQLDSLPALAPVTARILSLTEDDRSSAKQLVELIESDPSLTARVLSLLSRSAHGVQPKAVTVENAVVLLGFDAIRQATLALKVMEALGPARPASEPGGFDRAEFWKHCLAVACAARRIAVVVKAPIGPEEAFVCGLLHDLGKVALDAAMPKSFARIVRRCDETRADIADVERAILGLDHTAVGHGLSRRWGLPQHVVDCIWLHHQVPEALPPSVAADRHVQLVQLADTLVREQRIGYSGNHRFLTHSRQLGQNLGLSESQLFEIAEALAGEIESRAAWIGAEEIGNRDLILRALMQTTEELTSANAALAAQNQRLERKAQYFLALGHLNQAVCPGASVRQVCGACAEALRRALSLPAVLVFVTSPDGRWVEFGRADADVQTDIEQRPADAPDESADAELAVQAALLGTWIAPPGRAFDALVDRFRGLLGEGPLWLLPLVRERRWVGGALFAAAADAVADLRSDGAEIEALSAAVGLAITQAQSQAASLSLSNELAEANRRMVAMQAELLQARTLESVAGMATGAAHELNTPLAVISGRAQMLRRQATGGEVRDALDTIVQQARLCSDIVSELMEFAQPRPPKPEAIELKEMLETLQGELVAEGLLDAADVSIETASDTSVVWCDREQLIGTFRELLRNSIEATDPTSRRLTVKATADLAEETVVIVVADNGSGMTADVQARAMDPFFSRRPAGRGRGLGLARVQRWVQQNGGTIRLDSSPEKGTQVELRLPAREASNA